MSAPDKQELLPCPFCGGVNLSYYYNAIRCDDCLTEGPPDHDDTDEGIRSEWNTRTKPSCDVVLSITQGRLEAALLSLEYASNSDDVVLKSIASDCLEDFRSQTTGRAGQ